MTEDRATGAAVDDDKIDSPRQVSLEGQQTGSTIEMTDFGPVDALLRHAERRAPGAAHLDEDKLSRWARIRGEDVDLVSAEPYVPPDQLPA